MDPLIYQIQTKELELLLQLGIITREKHRNELSTLDLYFSTLELALRVVKCIVTDTYKGSDHLPIETEFIIGNTIHKDLKPRRNFYNINTNIVVDKVR